MANELPRPGVEVVQEFRSAAPTIIRPTLVPVIVGAAKEIVEVTTADGLLNSSAKQGVYDQLPRIISQTSFPSPRNNITEVDVEESTIKAFMQFGGELRELPRTPGEAFLASHNYATIPAIRTTFVLTSTGFNLNGKLLILAIDETARLDVTGDVTVTFSSTGGNLTPAQVAAQINEAVGQTVASVITVGSNSRIQIASTKYGASASVTVRAGGSANTELGFASSSVEYRIEGSGFRAQDLNNNTTISPWIEWSKGSYQTDGVVQSSLPVYDDTVPTAEVGFGFLNEQGVFSTSYVQGSTLFTGINSLDLKVGDIFFADGAQPNSTSVIMKVETSRFKLGVLNSRLSVFDDNGNVVSAVYDESKVNTLFAASPFAPRYTWFRATGLTTNPANTYAALTGSKSGAAATTATITAPAIPSGSAPYSLAGLYLEVDVTIDGDLQDTYRYTFTGGPFANLAAVVAAVGTNIPGVFAHTDLAGTHFSLSTTATGASQSLVVKDTSTALAALGFTASTEYTGTGADVEFKDLAAVLTSTAHTFPFTAVVGETLIVQVSTDGGATWPISRTFTHASAGPHANIAALLAAINTAGNWDGGTLPTQFTITNSSNQLVITSASTGSLIGLRIGSASTGLGVTTNGEIGFTSLQSDIGEENLNGQTLKFKLNNRDKIYSVLFTSDSLVDAIDLINTVVGHPVASIGGTSDDKLVLTSTLKGYASKVEVIDDSTSMRANASLGFSTGNFMSSGSGRPNSDFSLDVSGNIVLGPEILRSQLTGYPFDPGTADIYVQYRGLRKDVSPLAKDPSVLKISDTATLSTVLSPINPDNPLALGMFFAMLNAPGIEISGLGIDEITPAAPFGTLQAYTRAANLLESEEVYAIAPLTFDETVHSMFKTHVEYMSGSAQKGERILFVAAEMPKRAVNDVLASGTSSGTTATANQLVVDVNPTPAIIAKGLNPLSLSYDDQVFVELTVEGQVRKYLVTSVNGTLLTLSTTFATDENTDDFFSVTNLTEEVINADWSVAIRGDLLLIPGSSLPDKSRIAETVAAKSSSFKQRRMYNIFPDTVVATLDGSDTVLPAFYICAAKAGMVARFAPQQGFTQLPITGFTAVKGSDDMFSVSQLDVMAGGGTYIIIQEAEGAPLMSRHQLSTNILTIEQRELSITKVVDFAAKFFRIGLRNFIGTFNITQPFLDTLSTVIQGMIQFFVENGIIVAGELNNVIQSTEQPDTVLVDVTLSVPYPCNYIRLTLAI